MELVVDANVLFSALIKDSITARLFFLDRLHLYAPEFLLEEFDEHRDLILRKTHRSDKEFDLVLNRIFERIHFEPRSEFESLLEAGNDISPDRNDSIYFALALKIGAPIWSNDSRLKKQKVIRIFTTSDIVHMFSSELAQ